MKKNIKEDIEEDLSWIKPGTTVLITKSKENWIEEMDEYAGTVQVIRHATKPFIGSSLVIKFVETDPIAYDNINDFIWVYDDKHFVRYFPKKKTVKLNLKMNKKCK